MAPYRTRVVWGHPKASASGCVYEHVLIAERAMGHYLPPRAEIHHVDNDRRNNSNRNLVICPDHAYHMLLHVRQAVKAADGDPNTQRQCSTCRALKPFAEFNQRRMQKAFGLQTACRSCQVEYQKTYTRPDLAVHNEQRRSAYKAKQQHRRSA